MAPDESPYDFEQAFDALVRHHYERLANLAHRYLRSDAAAEDAVQEVLLKVWRQRDVLCMADPLPYLYRAVRNECLMALRRRRRWIMTELEDESPGGTAVSQSDPAVTELAAAVERAVALLPERCRLVYVMSREQNLSYAEIGRILGISRKTVENHMGRALKGLRDHLAPYLPLVLAALAASSR